MIHSGQLPKILLSLILLSLIGFASAPAVQAQEPPAGPALLYMPLIFKAEPPTWFGPDGGSIICLAPDPTNQSVVFAGTLNAGVFKSTDRGRTWREVNNGLGGLFIDSLTVDPSNGNIIYAGTHGQGVYKSTNGGASWSPVNTGIAENSVVYTLAVNPTNSNIVYAGTRIQDTEYVGILYRSLNGGGSWENVMYFSTDWVYSVAISRSAPNLVMAAVHASGPVFSYEYGAKGTWHSGSPPDGFSDYARDRWRKGRAVAFDPRAGSGRAHYSAWHDGFVFYSSNNGAKWNPSGGSLGAAQVYPNGISVKPGNPDIVYLADHDRGAINNVLLPGTVMRSTNAGLTYQPANLTRILYSVAALAGSGDTVLAGTYMDGLYRSENGGGSWGYSMAGLVNSYVTGMVFPNSSTRYASTKSGGGIFRSTDSGASWVVFNSGLGDAAINGLVMHPTNPNVLFALTNNNGLRRIDLSASSSWTASANISLADSEPTQEKLLGAVSAAAMEFGEMIDPGDEALFSVELNTAASAPVLALAFAPSNANIAYMGTNGGGVYASSNGGASWSQVGLAQGVVRGIAVSPSSPNQVYAATNEKGTARISSDGGRSWATARMPDSTVEVYSVAILPGIPGEVYFGTSNGVFRYNGSAWVQVGLGGYQVYALGYHPGAAQRLVAGTHSGGFTWHNGTTSWSSIAGEVADKRIVSLNFDPSDARYVYLGTEYQGTLRVLLTR